MQIMEMNRHAIVPVNVCTQTRGLHKTYRTYLRNKGREKGKERKRDRQRDRQVKVVVGHNLGLKIEILRVFNSRLCIKALYRSYQVDKVNK